MIFIIFNNHSQSTIIHSFIVRNSPRPVFLYPATFCTEMFSLLWNGSDWLSDSVSKVRYASSFVPWNGVVFSSAEWFWTEFRKLASIFVTRTRIPSSFSSAEGFRTEFREVSVPRNSSGTWVPLINFLLYTDPHKLGYIAQRANCSKCTLF
jgi:hypothetical protein